MTSAPASDELSNPESRKIGRYLLPYLALVLVHLLSGLAMEQPLILADEVGYLGNARYLSGAAHLPDMQGTQFYHFGYSLFLLPAFWLFAEPVSIYKAALAINALLIGALYFPLYSILNSTLQVVDRTARWIAFACCLYPPLVLYSSFAWSENAFIPFYATAAALFGRYLASRATRDALLFSLVASFLYTIHPRALPVVVAVLGYLLLLALLKAIPVRQLVLSAAAMASVMLVTRIVNQHLKAAAWAGGGEVSATRLAGRLVPGADFPALVERALGQLLYLSIATHGLFLLGLMAMIWLIARGVTGGSLRQALASPVTGVPVFILASASGIFAAACTLKLYSLHGQGAVRGADFIHGRYNESLAIFAIAYALAELCRKGLGNRRLAWRVIAAIVLLLGLSGVVMAEVDDALKRQVAGRPGVQAREEVPPSAVEAVAVPGVYPIVGLLGALDLHAMALTAIAALLLIAVTTRFSRPSGVLLLILLFCLFSYYNYRHYLLPRMAKVRPRLALAAEARRLGPPATISYDAAHREPGFIPAMQFLLQDAVFERFDSSADGQPASQAVLSGSNWAQAERLGARFVRSSGRGTALWLLPGEMQSRIAAVDYEGVNLGVERRLDLQETGFYRTQSFAGVPGRWTNGSATLRVPLDPEKPPRTLEISTLLSGRDGLRLHVLANGVQLWRRPIPRGAWSRTFRLSRVPLGDDLLIELRCDTFSPASSNPPSRDSRQLGVVVTGIRLSGVASPRP